MNVRILLLVVAAIAPIVVRPEALPRLLPFQARLSDGSGKPYPDGSTILLFQVFSEPTGGTLLWAGETHRVTVTGGIVNVVLGTKNPLPLNYPDDSRPFFAGTLYLQVIPDTNADTKITPEDSPILPRQSIIPVLFATESAVSRTSMDSAKLAGHDWSAILADGATDPVLGSINGARLAKGSIRSEHISSGSVGADQLSDSVVTPKKLAPETLQSLVPTGALLAFFSRPVPQGWIECDGRHLSDPSLVDSKFNALKATLRGQGMNTLPDMRDAFVKGALAGESIGAKGGNNRAVNHKHSLNSNTYPPGWGLLASRWVDGGLPEYERVQPTTSSVIGLDSPEMAYSNAPKFVSAVWMIKY